MGDVPVSKLAIGNAHDSPEPCEDHGTGQIGDHLGACIACTMWAAHDWCLPDVFNRLRLALAAEDFDAFESIAREIP